jgi:predicted nucleic acid-binding protein
MNTPLVVDNSVAVKFFLPEEHSANALSLLAGGYDLHAPALILYEFGNVMWRKVRGGFISRDEAMGLVSDFTHIPIARRDSAPLAPSAMHIATMHDRTFYDAMYVALTQALGARLVTADARLFNQLRDVYPDSLLWIVDVPLVTGAGGP